MMITGLPATKLSVFVRHVCSRVLLDHGFNFTAFSIVGLAGPPLLVQTFSCSQIISKEMRAQVGATLFKWSELTLLFF